MFEGLRAKLQKIQGGLSESIESAAEEEVSPPARPAGEKEKDATLLGKVRVLITDREFVIDEKDIREPLFELEMVLLENDVALPVTEEIISHIKKDLEGTRRKIGEPVDVIVAAALRKANYQGPFLFETSKHKDGTPVKVPEMVDFVRGINGARSVTPAK